MVLTMSWEVEAQGVMTGVSLGGTGGGPDGEDGGEDGDGESARVVAVVVAGAVVVAVAAAVAMGILASKTLSVEKRDWFFESMSSFSVAGHDGQFWFRQLVSCYTGWANRVTGALSDAHTITPVFVSLLPPRFIIT